MAFAGVVAEDEASPVREDATGLMKGPPVTQGRDAETREHDVEGPTREGELAIVHSREPDLARLESRALRGGDADHALRAVDADRECPGPDASSGLEREDPGAASELQDPRGLREPRQLEDVGHHGGVIRSVVAVVGLRHPAVFRNEKAKSFLRVHETQMATPLHALFTDLYSKRLIGAEGRPPQGEPPRRAPDRHVEPVFASGIRPKSITFTDPSPSS